MVMLAMVETKCSVVHCMHYHMELNAGKISSEVFDKKTQVEIFVPD